MKPIISCPVCNGKAHVETKPKKRKFRGEEFEVYEHYYKCKKCNHSFINDDADSYNLELVHSSYREKYNIPFPEQLIAVRESYELSQTKMSELLGFGLNQYRLYESGDIPVGGNATILNLIIDPWEFKIILKKRPGIISVKDEERINKLITSWKHFEFNERLKYSIFPKIIVPDRFTGYKLPSFKKLANMVLFFISNAPFKTRLNKLLSFSDFAHFKYFAHSISGCRYAAIDMGSVPDQYSIIYSLVEKFDFISTETVKINDNEVEKFIPLKDFDHKHFTESELDIMQTVLNTFESKSTFEITQLSHKELAWIENEKTKSRIDYSVYAPQLKAV